MEGIPEEDKKGREEACGMKKGREFLLGGDGDWEREGIPRKSKGNREVSRLKYYCTHHQSRTDVPYCPIHSDRDTRLTRGYKKSYSNARRSLTFELG